EAAQVELLRDQVAHDGLLSFDELVGVHDQEIELGAHGEVLLEDAPLKDAEAFIGVGGEAQVHARLEVLELWPAFEDALEGDFEVGLEEEGQVGQGGEAVDAPDPLGRAAARHIAPEGGKDVAVAQDEVTGAQQRHQVTFVAVGEVRGVDEAEGGGGQQFSFLALARGGFDELGRVPLAEIDFEVLQLQPTLEEVDLGGFSRAIQAFHGDQPAG